MALPQPGVAVPAEAPPELTAGGPFDARVRRLAAVSVPGLGSTALLARVTLDAPAAVEVSLAAGWVLMPTLLLLSTRRPALRYALALPSLLVGGPLLLVCLRWLPGDAVAAAGWLSLTCGILLGGVLGLWFWYRLLPVPAVFEDPFSPGRWALVGTHVALVVGGLLAVAVAAVSQ